MVQLINTQSGLFNDPNPATATDGTLVTSDWLNAVQTEQVNFIQAAGLSPSPSSNNQLLTAAQTLFLHTNNPVANGSLTIGNSAGSAGIEIGNTTAASTPFVDFHSSGSANDYDVRLIASGGTSGTSGAGTLSIAGGQVNIQAPLTSIYGGGNFSLKLQSDGTCVWYSGASPLFAIGGTGAYTNQPFTSYANVNAKYDVVVNGSVGAGGGISAGGPATNNFQFSGGPTDATNPVGVKTNGFYAANGGVFSYSTTAASAYFGASVTNGPVVNFYGTGTTPIGSITNNNQSGVSYNTTSDYRLKKDVESISATEASQRIAQLKPSSFIMTTAQDPERITGFIAHEYGAVYPTSLFGAKDAVDSSGNIIPQQIDTNSTVPDLVAVVQDLLSRITKLESSKANAATTQ